MAEVTYYFDGGGTTGWSDGSYMWDNILTNYAYTSNDGKYQGTNSNTCLGSDLGAITLVEMRAYGYGDGDDRIDITPHDSAGDWVEIQLTMPGSAGWSSYGLVTGRPGGLDWTWAIIAALDAWVEYDKSGKGNTMYCAKVEIRVTYSEGVPPGWNQLQYTEEPPTPNAWNQVKREAGTGYRKLEYS